MKFFLIRLKLIALLFLFSYVVSAQNNFWRDVSGPGIEARRDSKIPLPKKYRTLFLDTAKLLSALRSAPKEFTQAAKSKPFILVVPMPDGSYNSFKIVETSMMEPELAAKFPNMKTFGGQGVDDPTTTIKLDWTELGFHAVILSQKNGSVFIDPYTKGERSHYISYNKKDLATKQSFFEKELLANKETLKKNSAAEKTAAVPCIGETLRIYRLAVACTWQYSVAVAGRNASKSQVLSAILTTVNRVDGVYETEVDIRLSLIDNTKIIYIDSASQPFTANYDAVALADESQVVIDTAIGTANYDIGHTFSTVSDAFIGQGYAPGIVCNNNTKAMGVTGMIDPVGDAFAIDFVAHEMGHQFGAAHTFNATTGSCSGAGNDVTNAEPGSGVTIMAYAGSCDSGVNDLQQHSIPYFHAVSFDQITTFINNGNGASCGRALATGNRPPVVNAGNDYIIPKSTPFVLTGSATDPDGDALTYSWEEVNVGGSFTDWNKPLDDAPIFRSFAPATTPVRYFPQISDIVNNTTTIGEILPSYARTLRFRLTARDNRAGGGGVCFDSSNVAVDGVSGPFRVTAPDTATTMTVGNFTTITWDVAGSNKAPVNCTNVSIELSTDGGLTFPITLSANTPNDGEEEVIVPNYVTTQARVRVKAVNNIFFDISNQNFTIKSTTEKGFVFSNPLPVKSCKSSNAGTVISTNSLNGFSTPITLSASGNPAGSTVIFSGNPINPGASDSISLIGTVPNGVYDLTVTGKAGSVVKTRVIEITVGSPASTPVIYSPSNNSTGSPLLPTFTWKTSRDANFYTLQISTSPTFATTVQSIDSIANSSYTLTTPLADNTQFYWRITSHNLCGSGPASASFLFKTVAIVCEDLTSKDVPKTIDTIATIVTSTLTIPAGGIIQDVNVVGLKGKHSLVSDITVTLISPSRTSVELFAEDCYDSKDFNLNFDDEAANDIACPLDSLQTARPMQPLSAFIDENSTGTWTLEISDPYPEDGGSLDNWGLRICTYKTTALPVNWIGFTAYKNENKTVVLQWSTGNEINNDHYEIEKSTDGVTFINIGKINAGTNTVGVQQYIFNDLRPDNGINYYRLKQVDKDGKYTYSKIVSVYFDETSARYIVYPNPAVDKSTIRILSEIKHLTLRLADASGKTVYESNVSSVRAGAEFEIPVKAFGKGFYILTLTTEKGISNEKIIVQ